MDGGILSFEDHKAVVEAALFVAGRVLTLQELSELSGANSDEVRILADELAGEYSQRYGGVEIVELGNGYVMQVRPKLAKLVVSVAPREMEAPLIRTLAVIAYKQPIKQSDVAKIRGNKSYSHIKELERIGLISSIRQGHTKILTTTKGFADYFGLPSEKPDSVKKVVISEKKPLGFTPLYESLALRLGLDFILVNPYSPQEADFEKLERLDILVMVPGYKETISKYFSGRIIEARTRTLSQLKESAERICQASGSGRIEPLANEIDALLFQYRERAKNAGSIKPLTPMAEEIARDLLMSIHENGISVATDYSGLEADLILLTHQAYDMDIIERIKLRYDRILSAER
ncbi:MAG: SMC-Scp complex subunit ScpB [Methanotrichaceae archaeon]|nr:SMC-Scp complex subunit ScpB [Methanotrichaceae archaeon]